MPPAPARRSTSGSTRLTATASTAGRKTAVKGHRRGEEQIEIPNTAAVADGKRYFFIGGFSKYDSINALAAISQEKETTGTDVTVMPGTYTVTAAAAEEGAAAPAAAAAASGAPVEVAVRTLDIKCYQPQSAQPQSKVVIAVDDQDGDADGADAGDDAHAHGGAADAAAQIVAPPQPPITGDVTFTGNVVFTRYVAPAEAAAPLAALQPEPTTMLEPRQSRAMSMRSTASKKSIASTDETTSAAGGRGETPNVAAAQAQQEEQHGARPSTWPTVTFTGVCFERCSVTLKSAHAVFEKCHFVSPAASYYVTAMPYCRATFVECTFQAPAKAALYAYPFSAVTAKQCHFSGLNLSAIQEDRSIAATLAAERLEKSSRGDVNNAAVMADDAAVVLDNCHVLHLTHGVVLHGRCADSRIRKCVFESIDGSAAYFGAGAQPIFYRNFVAGSCTGRGIFFGPGAKPKASSNIVASRTIISQGSGPLLKANQFQVRIEEQNDIANPYMQPKY